MVVEEARSDLVYRLARQVFIGYEFDFGIDDFILHFAQQKYQRSMVGRQFACHRYRMKG